MVQRSSTIPPILPNPSNSSIPSIGRNLPQVSVETATGADIPAMASLLDELFRLEKDFVPDRDKQVRGLAMILAHPDRGRLLVLKEAGIVTGMANLLFSVSTAEGGPVILLEDFIIAGAARGKGYGRYLMEQIFHMAQAEGFLRITVLVDGDNEGAHPFYQRLGYGRSNMICYRRHWG
ncbi:GNAT family N-acetyltransferase [Heliobacterium gestii]|uniref:GNAT family N-acetyltransferase n=1 Tax=Heliomicrobium gestii TaxID=2699 RepID=A0A845L4L1_HELGE|nr:GNAT family N-acetyltransferase [Heliomicrobium gestii]MBM7865242.1 GNAT superfamily N-acetyltransferase [Heliomicrobium gestii]MZP41507.1 GNAT family N-acetyltransferase [Heliomicrobium gestii]